MKSCVGSTWCRYGVQDSVGFAVRVENALPGNPVAAQAQGGGVRLHPRVCRGQSKDFGLIATEKGWNLYVCGTAAHPRHADLLAADLDEETALSTSTGSSCTTSRRPTG